MTLSGSFFWDSKPKQSDKEAAAIVAAGDSPRQAAEALPQAGLNNIEFEASGGKARPALTRIPALALAPKTAFDPKLSPHSLRLPTTLSLALTPTP